MTFWAGQCFDVQQHPWLLLMRCLSLVMTSKSVPRHCQMSLEEGEQIYSHLRTNALDLNPLPENNIQKKSSQDASSTPTPIPVYAMFVDQWA